MDVFDEEVRKLRGSLGTTAEDPIVVYRKEAITAAKELRYEKKVIAKIKEAKTYNEIQRIMITARREGIRKDEEKHGRL